MNIFICLCKQEKTDSASQTRAAGGKEKKSGGGDYFLQGWGISWMYGQPSRMPGAEAVRGWEAVTRQHQRMLLRLLGFSCCNKWGSILAGQLMPSTPSSPKRREARRHHKEENDISRVTHTEGK